MSQKVQRRLAWICLLFVASSCTSSETQPVPATPSPTAVSSTSTPAPSSTSVAESWEALDLRFAHVLAVDFEILDNAQVRFDVTMVHDDAGEAPNFADWWQVEDLSGTVLGKRVLAHEHGARPFTRSATIEIPSDVEIVIIRGHDMLHGFGGQIIQINLASGEQLILTPDA